MKKTLLKNLLALSIIIIIHELGHFIWCHIFGIPTPVFSVGFGPQLIGIKWGETVYQIAMLPFGGYVSMDRALLDAAPYWQKIIITLAGVFNNFVLAAGCMKYFSPHTFWYSVGIMNLQIGFFNLLPIPMLDGGQALRYTLTEITQLFGSKAVYIHLFLIIIIVISLLLANRIRSRKQSASDE